MNPMRYIGINCDNCGRFVGKEGRITTDTFEMTGELIIDSATCVSCLNKELKGEQK